jgi:hypothetical protein
MHEITLPLETPKPFVLSPSPSLRRILSKDDFAEIIVCLFLGGNDYAIPENLASIFSTSTIAASFVAAD